MAEMFPKTAIDIFVEVLQADAGTRTAAINASSIALADAGIPMKGLITSCAFGKVDGQIVLDLNKEEDNYGEADFPVAMTQDGEITLVQMDGNLTPDEIKKGLELVKKGCKEILAIQQAVLRKKFETPVEEVSEEPASEKEAETEEEQICVTPEAAVIVGEALEAVEELGPEILEESVEAEVLASEVIPDFEEEPEEDIEEGIEEDTEEDIEEEFETDEEEAFEEEAEPEEDIEEDLEEDLGEELEEEEFEEEALEEEAEFESSFEAAPELKEFDEIEVRLDREAASEEAEEEMELEDEEFSGEELEEEEAEIEETPASEKETIESETEAEPEVEAEEISTEAEEAEEELEEEKSEGPWKVVKDPSEAGTRGEKDE